MTSVDDEHRLAEQRSEEIRKQTEEYVVPASEADFIEIARRTNGMVAFNHYQPAVVQWNWHKNTLQWVGFDEEKKLHIKIEQEDQVKDLSSYGIVMGLNYVAFVEKDPNEEGLLKAYIATRDNLTVIQQPSSMFVPFFEQAASLGLGRSDSGEQGSAAGNSGVTE